MSGEGSPVRRYRDWGLSMLRVVKNGCPEPLNNGEGPRETDTAEARSGWDETIKTRIYEAYAASAAHEPEADEWPKFLARDRRALAGALTPPLLPGEAPQARFARRIRRWPSAKAVLLSAAMFVTASLVSVFAYGSLINLKERMGGSLALSSPSGSRQLQAGAASAPDTAAVMFDDVSAALRVVAGIEARLAYAGDLARHLQHVQAEQSPADAASALAGEVATVNFDEQSGEAVGMLVLRNLPAGVAFSGGAQAGEGAWAISAGDPEQIVMSMGEGLDRDVYADVEMYSHAGVSLGSVRMLLHKKPVHSAGGPVAQSQMAAQSTASLKSSDNDGDNDKAGANDDRPASRTAKVVKPKTKRTHAQAHKKQERAIAEAKVRARPRAAPQQDEQTADAGDKKPGLLAKFFSWLKGGTTEQAKVAAPSEDADDNTAVRSSLGMSRD